MLLFVLEVELPGPGVAHGVFDRHFCTPTEDGVGLCRLCPDLLYIACTTLSYDVWHCDAGSALECVNKFEHRETTTCAEVEYLYGFSLIVFKHSLHGYDVSFRQIDHVDEVAYARTIRSVVVVTKDCELLANTGSSLRQVRDKVVRHTIWQLPYQCRWVSAYGVEIAQDDALNRCSRTDIVVDNLFGNLLGVAVGRCRHLDRCSLVDRVDIGLAIDRTR